MLKVNDLEITAKSTGEQLVKGISFAVGRGETIGLIGESGSGKSLTGKSVEGSRDTQQKEKSTESVSGTADRHDYAKPYDSFRADDKTRQADQNGL